MSCKKLLTLLPVILVALLGPSAAGDAVAGDWPMWRYGANRGAATPHELPSDLRLKWVRQYPALRPAWGGELDIYFDKSYEPVVMGKTMFVGSSRNDSLTAIDTDTGAEKWKFYADGPIRFAPVGWRGKVYFASDDGRLYCLNATDGTLRWKFRGGLSDRKGIGNQRLISAWPARGGPVLVDGKIYFAAGIWPFMGVSVHALDAETGEVVWTNDRSSYLYSSDRSVWPRNEWVPSADGISPQGHLVAVNDKLIVPCGRGLPAVLDIKTGKLLYVRATKGGRAELIAGIGDCFFAHGMMFSLSTGRRMTSKGYIPDLKKVTHAVLTEEAIYLGGVTAIDIRNAPVFESTKPPKNETPYVLKEADLKAEKSKRRARNPRYWTAAVPNYWPMTFAKPSKRKSWQFKQLWSDSLGERVTVRMKAGKRLYGAGPNLVVGVDLPDTGAPAGPKWERKIEGTPASLLAADGKLFVVTEQGSIYCFGAGRVEPKTYSTERTELHPPADEWTKRVRTIVERTGVREGYCLVIGVGTGRLAEELVLQTKLDVIAVDGDAQKIDSLRRRWDSAGLYGNRLTALVADPLEAGLPPYLASLIVSEDLTAAGFGEGRKFAEKVFYSLRPYGGVALLRTPPSQAAEFAAWVKDASLPSARVERSGEFTLLSRPGPLPGSDAWSHQYANAGDTQASRDRLVKAPLGVLWFGGPSSRQAIAHQKSGNPIPRVAGGRMYVEGKNMLHAFDAYTGRLLWKAEFADAPRPAKTQLVTVHDAVYRVTGTKLMALDARTGKALTGFQFDQEGQWGAIKVWKNFLIAPVGGRLLVANRHTGDVLWKRDRSAPLAVAIGGGMLFCVESDSPSHEDSTRRGQSPGKPLLVALNVKDGNEIWRKTEGHGPRLTYSESHDVLLVTDSVAYRGKDGTKLWGAPSLRAPRSRHRSVVTRNMIFANSQRRKLFRPRNLLTGEDFTQDDPWTGKVEPFHFSRSHGCGGILGGEHILTFRSSAAGFFDLVSRSGTSNFGGFRSGCVPNLVPADGLLNAPTNVRGCSCTWPIRTSLAMVHMPELEMWAAYLPYGWLDERDHAAPVKRLGLNFGAPGDRRLPGGTLWVDYPSVGGPSPEVRVRTVPEVPESFRYHSMRVAGSGLKWVAASGLKGVESLSITLDESGGPERRFTIRLHFAEPDKIAPGQRVFDVKLQGQSVLNDFDAVEEAGGPNRAVVREFTGIRVGRDLKVAFEPSAHSPLKAALICGIEIVEESPSGVAGAR